MKKLFLIVAIATTTVLTASAQDNASGFHIGAGIKLGLPIGDMADMSEFGFGAEVQGEYMFSEKISAVASAGFMYFKGKDLGGLKVEDGNFVPVLAGIRFYPATNIFIGAKAGYTVVFSDGETGGGFSYEPQIGYNAEKFQIYVGYNATVSEDILDPSKNVTQGFIGLGAIYKFN